MLFGYYPVTKGDVCNISISLRGMSVYVFKRFVLINVTHIFIPAFVVRDTSYTAKIMEVEHYSIQIIELNSFPIVFLCLIFLGFLGCRLTVFVLSSVILF